MRNVVLVAVLLAAAGVAVCARPAAPQPPAPRRPTVFTTLRVGQAVSVREKAGLYVIGTLDGIDQQTHTLTEVGDDYLAVKDLAGLTETRIPVTAVRAVVHAKAR